MSEISDRFVAILDANVLYPFYTKDILLCFAEAGLYRARWSQQILDEWTGSLIAEHPELEESVLSQRDAMMEAFDEAMVEGFDNLISAFELPDENDRHVIAAAVQCGAQLIVTDNLKDFPIVAIEPYGLEAYSADEFLTSTFDLYPSKAVETIRMMRNQYDNPFFTPDEFLTRLRQNGLGQLVERLKSEIDAI